MIRDQTDYVPCKGQVLKDQDRDAFFAGTADALVEFLAGLWVQAGSESQRFVPFLPKAASAHRVLPSEHFPGGHSPTIDPAEPPHDRSR